MGKHAPGEKLQPAVLAARFDVSLGVVREAVSRLGSGELVVATPQRGFRVRGLSETDLVDLTFVRSEVETLALARALAHGTIEWEAQLVAAEHTLRGCPVRLESGDYNPEWIRAHDRFHAALTSACESPTLLRFRQELFDAATLYLYWVDVPSGRRAEREHEHRSLVQAALARDVGAATTTVRAHLARAKDSLIAAHRERAATPTDD